MRKRQPRGASYHRMAVWAPPDLVARLDRQARAEGSTRSRRAVDILGRFFRREAREDFDDAWRRSGARRQVGLLQADLQARHGLARDLAESAFYVERILTHWMVRSGALGLDEDELLAEARVRARDEVQQALYESAREGGDGLDDVPPGKR